MTDKQKTKQQLIDELVALRLKCSELEKSTAEAQKYSANPVQFSDPLHESDDVIHAIFNQSTDGLILIDAATAGFVKFNEAIHKNLGYSREEFSKLNVRDIQYLSIEELDSKLQKAAKQDESRFETIHKRKDGSHMAVEVNTRLLNINERTYYIAVWRDITERKRAEEELRRTERKLTLAMELAQLYEWIYDVSSGLFTFSDRYFALHCTTSEIEGGNVLTAETFAGKFVHPDDVHIVGEEIGKAIETADPNYHAQVEARIICRYGDIRHVLVHIAVIKDDKGKTIKISGANQDITARKQAEAERAARMSFVENLDLVNRAINHEAGVERLLWNITEAVFKIFGCDRAWLVYPCDPSAPSFRVPVEVCRPEYPGAKVLNLEVPMSPCEALNMQETLESGELVTYTDSTERPVTTAKQFGVQSQMYISVHPKMGKPWLFGMHQCSYARLWKEEEKTLFKAIARRMADALGSVLFVQELQENVTKKKQLEAELMRQIDELQRFRRLTVDREFMMIELKKEINELLKQNGQEEKYRIVE
jgi:PAS domain S-box-containing protein